MCKHNIFFQKLIQNICFLRISGCTGDTPYKGAAMKNPTQSFSSELLPQTADCTACCLKLYRRRLIPHECIPLPHDIILSYRDGVLVTSWQTIRPKKNMDHGYSCYYLKEGYKISKFYRADNTLLYCYCDIISPAYEDDTHTLTVTDLLADVIVYPDGSIQVVDLDELADAYEQGMLSASQLMLALRTLDRLLSLLYEGKLEKLLAPIAAAESASLPPAKTVK